MKAAESVVPLYVDGQLAGTGVFVAPGKLVTNLHVLDRDYQVHPMNNLPSEVPTVASKDIQISVDGRQYPAQVLRGNQSHDLVLLKTEARVEHLPLVQEPARVGQEVRSIGYANNALITGPGVIQVLNQGGENEAPLVLHNAPATLGCSGGALINSKNELLGIQCVEGPTALPVDWVKELLVRTDDRIISRGEGPKTEIDYYGPSVKAVDPRITAKVFDRREYMNALTLEWFKERPHSVFATERAPLPVGLDSETAQKIGERFEAYYEHYPSRQNTTKSIYYRDLANLSEESSPLFLHYLKQAYVFAETSKARATCGWVVAEQEASRKNFTGAFEYAKAALVYANQSEAPDDNLIRDLYRLLVGCSLIAGDEKKAHEYFSDMVAADPVYREWGSKQNVIRNVCGTLDEKWKARDGVYYALCQGEHTKRALENTISQKIQETKIW